jgi:hypothetical protein
MQLCIEWMKFQAQVKTGWRRPLQITDVQWRDPADAAGAALIEVESIRSAASLWDVVMGRDFEVVVGRPRVDGSVSPDGELHLQRVAQVALSISLVLPHTFRACM